MKKLLAIDDVEVCRYTIENALSEEDISVYGAADLDEALTYLSANKVDIILLDWHLKKNKSTDHLDQIRKLAGAQTPIFMMSAIEQNISQAIIKEHDLNGFLTKPIDKAQIITILKEHNLLK